MPSALLTTGTGSLAALLLCTALVAGSARPSAAHNHGLSLQVVLNGADAPISYDLDAMRAMPHHDIHTSTPWTDGMQHFRGIPLSALLGDTPDDHDIYLRAINDYTVTMPFSAVSGDYPIVAYEHNGSAMSVRDKGPYWLIFPFDMAPEFRTDSAYSRSVWQLVRIEVMP